MPSSLRLRLLLPPDASAQWSDLPQRSSSHCSKHESASNEDTIYILLPLAMSYTQHSTACLPLLPPPLLPLPSLLRPLLLLPTTQ
jgi:hypothetical protein